MLMLGAPAGPLDAAPWWSIRAGMTQLIDVMYSSSGGRGRGGERGRERERERKREWKGEREREREGGREGGSESGRKERGPSVATLLSSRLPEYWYDSSVAVPCCQGKGHSSVHLVQLPARGVASQDWGSPRGAVLGLHLTTLGRTEQSCKAGGREGRKDG